MADEHPSKKPRITAADEENEANEANEEASDNSAGTGGGGSIREEPRLKLSLLYPKKEEINILAIKRQTIKESCTDTMPPGIRQQQRQSHSGRKVAA